MALNLVDAKDPEYIPLVVVNAGLEFIDEELKKGRKVFVHCNQGISRAPSFGLLWMVGAGLIEDVSTFESAMAEYKEKHYPAYEPGACSGWAKQLKMSLIKRSPTLINNFGESVSVGPQSPTNRRKQYLTEK